MKQWFKAAVGDIHMAGALLASPGLIAMYRFDAVVATETKDEEGSFGLDCKVRAGGASDDSSLCITAGGGGVVNDHLLFSGVEFMESLADVPALAAHTVELWVRTACSACGLASLPSGGSLLLGPDGRLAAAAPGAAEPQTWASEGPAVNDGRYHFVAHSLGSSHGERLFVDGALVAQRSAAASSADGWAAAASKISFGAASADMTSTAIFTGEMDEAAVFSTEVTAAMLAMHMNAATWAGRGPTFAERHLAAPCQDSRVVQIVPPCGDR
ncbi:unnamed protein product, partial [Prorocentrum cordatum]